MKRITKTILFVVGGIVALGIVGFLMIQLVPVDRHNPPIVAEPRWDSPQTQALVQRACYDCHSNKTRWPWYSYVAPVSWLVAHDVEEGRQELNFSEWPAGRGEGSEDNEDGEHERKGGGEEMETDEVIEVVKSGEMPPGNYLLTHPEARLSDAEIQALLAGFQATFGTEVGLKQ